MSQEKSIQTGQTPSKHFLLTTIAAVILGAAGFYLRLQGLNYISGDMVDCYLPWYESLPAHQGIGVLRNYTGDYGLPYATMLWLLHYIPGEALVKIKAVSVFFEYICALSVGLLASHFHEGNRKNIAFVFGFGLTILYPVLIINGAYWGQCDAIYAAFVVLMIYALFKNKLALAFIFLGIAVASKLQTIFIIPFLIIYFFNRKNISIRHILLVPLTVEILYIPGIIAGYSPLTPITMYMSQTAEYPQMYMYYPSLWTYFWKWADYDTFHLPVIGWVALVYAFIFMLSEERGRIIGDKELIGIAFITSLLGVYFLPAMHERYSLIAEMIAIVYAIIHPKRGLVSTFLLATISWTIYQPLFMRRWPEHELHAIGLMIVLITLAAFQIYDQIKEDKADSPSGQTSRPDSSKESVLWKLSDKYIHVVVLLAVLGIVIISRRNLIRVYTPDYLSDLMENSENYHTAMYMLYIRIIDAVCKITDKDTYFLLKISAMLFDLIAAGLWTVIISKILSRSADISQSETVDKRNYKYSFTIAYLILPTTVFYSAIGGRVDGLCLALIGIGILFLNKYTDHHKKSYSVISGIAFGLATSIIPSYILLILGLFICRAFRNKSESLSADSSTPVQTDNSINYKAVITASLIIIVLSGLSCIPSYELIPKYYLALIGSIRISGAIITPVCFLFLILAYKDHRFLLPLLLMEFAAIMSIGRYMGVVDTKYLFLIPTFIAVSTVIAISTFISKLYSQLTAR